MLRNFAVLMVIAGLLTSCGFRRHKYENPITKDTRQPDKVLYDKAINDIERGRYEVARITLNTLINTYDQSEYLAKAKLAIADSWYREGGSHGLAQAEAEYKDFILFYPTMEESAESQMKICKIHYQEMEKPDRDMSQSMRAEDECRQMLTQFPNSKYVGDVKQMLRNIQEAIAEGEFRVGTFYHNKGSNPAAANRLQRLVDQYPLYSRADEALWELGDSYSRMGNRFRSRSGDAYSRIVRDYPLSGYADDAKRRLNAMELPVPEPDPAAVARMKYNMEHEQKAGMVARMTGFIRRNPDMHTAAKTGEPAMNTLRPTVPESVPKPVDTGAGFSGDVTASTVTDSSALDKNPDARQNANATNGSAAASAPAAQSNEPLPTNYQIPKKKKSRKKGQPQPAVNGPTVPTAPAAEQPAAPVVEQPASPPATKP